MIELRGYIDEKGKKRFADWFESLDPSAAAKVTIALTRMEQGNFSNAKSVGAGVYEYKIDFGPGYRIHLARTPSVLSFCSAAGRRNASKTTSRRRRPAGRTTNDEGNRRLNNAPYP